MFDVFHDLVLILLFDQSEFFGVSFQLEAFLKIGFLFSFVELHLSFYFISGINLSKECTISLDLASSFHF